MPHCKPELPQPRDIVHPSLIAHPCPFIGGVRRIQFEPLSTEDGKDGAETKIDGKLLIKS